MSRGGVLRTMLSFKNAAHRFAATQSYLADHVGWFYILCVNVLLGFSVYLLVSRFGELRLGGPEARPEFSRWGWFAMLFAAGMGIGLVL